MDTSRRARGASKRTYVDESENENESGDNFSEEEHGPRKKTRTEKRVVSPDSDSENMNEEDDLNGIPGIRTTPYEAGQILTVSVENFMCHRKFVVQLGRHLNFITGRNGSGKSAIVAAIQLCLGSSARQTGRGSNIGKYIREGCEDPAILKVTLLNQGPDAFRPDLYGNKITVKRVISKTTSSYHLLDYNQREISKLKSDLESMLRSFSIFVDTPCCVLTQEESKRMIHGSAHEKYEFFLKATGLKLIYDDLVSSETALAEAQIDSERHRPNVEAKNNDRKEKKKLMEEFLKLDSYQDDIRVNTAKLYWDEVRTAEGVVEELQEEAADKQELVDEAQEALQAVSVDGTDKERELQLVNEEFQQIEMEGIGITERAKEAQDALLKVNRQLGSRSTQLNDLKRAKRDNEHRLKVVTQELKQLQDKALQDADREERQVIDKIEVHVREIERLKGLNEEILRTKRDLQAEVVATQQNINNVTSKTMHKQRTGENLSNEIRSLASGGEQTRVNRFGYKVSELLGRISRTRFSGPVLGPVGVCVKIKDGYKDWSFALERTLFSMLKSFVVTTVQDRNTLYKIMRELGCHTFNSIILQHPCPRYNVATTTLPEPFLTVLDALNIDEDMIFNCLVDQLKIDQVAMTPDENLGLSQLVETQNGLRRLKFGLNRFISRNGTTVSFKQGNESSEPPRPNERCQNLLDEDNTAYAATLAAERETVLQEISELQVEMRELNQRHTSSSAELRCLNEALGRNDAALKTEHRHKQVLDNKLEEVRAAGGIDTTELEREISDLGEANKAVSFEIEQAQAELELSTEVVNACKERKAAADTARMELKKRLDKQTDALNKLMEKQADAKKRVAGLQKDLDNKCRALEAFLLEVEKHVVERDERVAAAQEKSRELVKDWDGEPLPLSNKETKHVLERRIAKLTAEWQEGLQRANLAGYNAAILTERYNAARDDYRAAKEKQNRMDERVDAVREAVDDRKMRWERAFKVIVSQTKRYFDFYANRQGSSGTVEIDPIQGEMRLIVQMDSQDKKTRATDVRNLSGGERSYVTLCLLLALGHVTESPFRLMDEYDVFMDEARRNDTLLAIQAHALSPEQRSRQVIVITPNSLASVKHRDEVRIFRMPDPQKTRAHGLQQQTID